MESSVANHSASSAGFYANGRKRMKLLTDVRDCGGVTVSNRKIGDSEGKKSTTLPKVIDYSDPFAVSNMINTINSGTYGSATKDLEEIATMRMNFMKHYLSMYPSLLSVVFSDKGQKEDRTEKESQQASDIIVVEDNAGYTKNGIPLTSEVVVIDSDDEEENRSKRPQYPFQSSFLQCQIQGVVPQDSSLEAVPRYPYQEVVLGKSSEQFLIGGTAVRKETLNRVEGLFIEENNTEKDMGVYVGVEYEEEESENVDDGLGDIWNQMAMAIECSKDTIGEASVEKPVQEEKEVDCEHSYVFKDDIGSVCRVCGVIDKRIDQIIDVQFSKAKRSTRTYASESRRDKETSEMAGIKFSEDGFIISGIAAHPRHMQQMKPHQIEGFNFLCSNLVSENPGGCILAHAPGSGKTFMIISFMQSFLAKYPHARALVVLPKGILSTWKREFQTWQVEDIPLLDLYSAKADSRVQQLEILKLWVEEKSILFLGYKQFSTIVCDTASNKTSVACQEILLKAPSILILDEGHTPRNENTDVLQSLAKVQTPRKVVLSGTLYQNHVKEVFNILNLVRPKFLKLDTSKSVMKRILSRAPISSVRKHLKGGADVAFYDIVEHTLQKDEDFKMKVSLIHDLREMTGKVLHYYKGDFLDELPGLVDFTVVLNLTSNQKREVHKLKKFERKFKVCSVGSAIYLHPKLKPLSEKSEVLDATMDEMLEKIDMKEGVKAKFFLNMIHMCDSAGEKLLVFSQYLVPLKFLERLAVATRGWKVGREIFGITGESSSEQRELSMDRFNNSSDAKLFFGSIKACGEGISLVGASRILILDVHLNPSVTRQAIGRAFRPGQKKKVHVYRLVAAESPEEDDHSTCFKKEVISKTWFEWNEYCGYKDFEVETVEVDECGDMFLETPALREDIKVLYKR